MATKKKTSTNKPTAREQESSQAEVQFEPEFEVKPEPKSAVVEDPYIKILASLVQENGHLKDTTIDIANALIEKSYIVKGKIDEQTKISQQDMAAYYVRTAFALAGGQDPFSSHAEARLTGMLWERVWMSLEQARKIYLELQKPVYLITSAGREALK